MTRSRFAVLTLVFVTSIGGLVLGISAANTEEQQIDVPALRALLAEVRRDKAKRHFIPRIAVGFAKAHQWTDSVAALRLQSPRSGNADYQVEWNDQGKLIVSLVEFAIQADDVDAALLFLGELQETFKRNDAGELVVNSPRVPNWLPMGWSNLFSHVSKHDGVTKAFELIRWMTPAARDHVLYNTGFDFDWNDGITVAEQTAAQISNPMLRYSKRYYLAGHLMHQKHVEEAIDIANKMTRSPMPEERQYGAHVLADAAAKTWQTNTVRARQLLETAEPILINEKGPKRDSQRHWLATLLARHGAHEDAARLSKGLSADWGMLFACENSFAHPLLASVSFQSKAGNFEAALKSARSLQEPRVKADALLTVALTMKAERPEEARTLAREVAAIMVSQLPTDGDLWSSAMWNFSGLCTLCQELEMETELKSLAAHQQAQNSAESALIKMYCDNDKFENAAAAVRPLFSNPSKHWLIRQLAIDSALAGKSMLFDELMDVLSEPEMTGLKGTAKYQNPDETYRRVALAAYEFGQKVLALEMLDRMKAPVIYPSAAASLCWKAGEADDFAFIQALLDNKNRVLAKQAMRPAAFYMLEHNNEQKAVRIAADHDSDMLPSDWSLTKELAFKTVEAGKTEVALTLLRHFPANARKWTPAEVGRFVRHLTRHGATIPQELTSQIGDDSITTAEIRLQSALGGAVTGN